MAETSFVQLLAYNIRIMNIINCTMKIFNSTFVFYNAEFKNTFPLPGNAINIEWLSHFYFQEQLQNKLVGFGARTCPTFASAHKSHNISHF